MMYESRRTLAYGYNEVNAFIENHHLNPSRHRNEEHDMLNWLKANRKRMNAGEMKEPRLSRFKYYWH